MNGPVVSQSRGNAAWVSVALAIVVGPVTASVAVIWITVGSQLADGRSLGYAFSGLGWGFAWIGLFAFPAALILALVASGITIAAYPTLRKGSSLTRARLGYAGIFSGTITLAAIVPFGFGVMALPLAALLGLIATGGVSFGIAWLFTAALFAGRPVAQVDAAGGA